ncbi:hypothetical protein C7W88_15105 [Novosphingobium sp. THN1]|uniref:GIY-YIG nuclease family protein n=1 Tax=Novosphingobium sp. THN1 TaxID=1016987 RepID=UPI000E49C401|nr:hypothetical protein C7W88_15105 [Novosphingobium sp. THN1]
MKVSELIQPPEYFIPFRFSHKRRCPDQSGCYILSNHSHEILYIGLTVNLSRRFEEHWDSDGKRRLTDLGRSIWFEWRETNDLETMERSWMNHHLAVTGALPVLNKLYSPTRI